jgi:phospholipase/carboxylesterase
MPLQLIDASLGGLDIRMTTPKVGAPCAVLLHGYAGDVEDLAPFAPSLGEDTQLVFPRGPIAGGGGRAWWTIDEGSRELAIARGEPRDLRTLAPNGLPAARALLVALLDELRERTRPSKLVLGGFSQGAMLSLDVSLQRDAAGALRPLDGLVLLAGAPIDWARLQPLLRDRAGTPVLVTHGRADEQLSFEVAEAMRDDLSAAGWDPTWVPFEGGHGTPLIVVRALRKFLATVLARA